MVPPKKKIVIVGGGLAGISTALFLSDPHNPKAREHDITVYQMGWRLGGKCASGRNFELGGRIEEHGLHLLLGFYENTFRMIRTTMAEWRMPAGHPWQADDPHHRWRNAFTPASFAPLVQRRRNGAWTVWPLNFPDLPGEPGDGSAMKNDLVDFLSALDAWLNTLLGMTKERSPDMTLRQWLAGTRDDEVARKRVNDSRHHRKLNAVTALPIVFGILRVLFLGMKRRGIRGWRRSFPHKDGDVVDQAQLLYTFVDIGSALFCGLLFNAVRVYRGTLDALDRYEFRAFLRMYGAQESSLDSPLIDALYDAAFACRGGTGRRNDQALAAGVAIRSFIGVTLAYKGAPWWKMNAGMGDTIFAPAYEVLKARGVKFMFFHRLRDIALASDGKSVEELAIGVQARTRNPESGLVLMPGEYEPLEPFDPEGKSATGADSALMTWPNKPRDGWLAWDGDEADPAELEDPESELPDVETVRLRAGRDFDQVVLAVPIAVLPSVCPELLKANPKVKRMVEKVQTVRTAAYQIWLGKNLDEMGWKRPSPVLGNFVDPLKTWSDMAHLIPMEGMQNGSPARNIAYFCGAMPDDIPASGARQYVAGEAQRMLDELAKNFLPGALDPTTSKFDTSLKISDYARANVNASERYTLSLPGTTQYRLRVDDTGVSNLVFAGDWTRNNFNVGAAEPTVMSAMQASNAICGYPALDRIVRNSGP